MNWHICTKQGSNSIQIPVGEEVPDGYVAEVTTSDPNYLAEIQEYVPRWVSAEDFMKRFTESEITALLETSRTNVNVAKAILEAQTSENGVDLNHPETIVKVGYLAMIGVISAARIQEILA